MNPRSLLLFVISALSLSNVNGLVIRDTQDAAGATSVTAQPASGCPIDPGSPPPQNLNSAFPVPHPPPQCRKADVRKEWRTLTKTQRASWITAVKCLSKKPHWPGLSALGKTANTVPMNTTASLYDDFVFTHLDLAGEVHLTGFFFIFHRLYMFTFDLALRQKCGYTGPTPYWNWSEDAPNFYSGSIWDDDPSSGLGRWGDPTKNYAITTGGFANGFTPSYPFPHTVRREYTPQPFNLPFFPIAVQPEIANSTFTSPKINALINSRVGDYANFQHDFEQLWLAHGSVHGILGGDLGGVCPPGGDQSRCANFQFSPSEPMFWLHHNNVDRLYYSWQHKNPQNFWAFHGGSVPSSAPFNLTTTEPNGAAPWLSLTDLIPNDNLLPNARIVDVIDSQGGFLCYTYDTTTF